MEQELNEAYKAGREAYVRGLDRKDNPYRYAHGDDVRYDFWLDGWLDAQWDSGDNF